MPNDDETKNYHRHDEWARRVQELRSANYDGGDVHAVALDELLTELIRRHPVLGRHGGDALVDFVVAH